MTGAQARRAFGPQIFADPNPAAHAGASARPVGLSAARRDPPVARIPDAQRARPLIEVPRSEAAGSGEWVGAATPDRLWDALARARAEYDPRILAAAESAVAALFLPVARERALAKAVRSWPRPDRPWGFEEYAGGAIDMEIRGAHQRHPTAGSPTSRSGWREHVPPAASLVQSQFRP